MKRLRISTAGLLILIAVASMGGCSQSNKSQPGDMNKAFTKSPTPDGYKAFQAKLAGGNGAAPTKAP